MHYFVTFSAEKRNITVQNTCTIFLLGMFYFFSLKAKYYCTKHMHYFVARDVLLFQLKREILLYKNMHYLVDRVVLLFQLESEILLCETLE